MGVRSARHPGERIEGGGRRIVGMLKKGLMRTGLRSVLCAIADRAKQVVCDGRSQTPAKTNVQLQDEDISTCTPVPKLKVIDCESVHSSSSQTLGPDRELVGNSLMRPTARSPSKPKTASYPALYSKPSPAPNPQTPLSFKQEKSAEIPARSRSSTPVQTLGSRQFVIVRARTSSPPPIRRIGHEALGGSFECPSPQSFSLRPAENAAKPGYKVSLTWPRSNIKESKPTVFVPLALCENGSPVMRLPMRPLPSTKDGLFDSPYPGSAQTTFTPVMRCPMRMRYVWNTGKPEDASGPVRMIPTYALKMVEGSDAAIRELEVLSKCVECTFIVKVLWLYEEGDYTFLAMEWISGGSLASIFKARGPLNPASIRRYTQHILRALDFLHSIDILHSDVK
eukprot:RCo036796